MVRITDNETALPEPNTLGVYAYDARGSRITQNTYDAGAAQKRIDHYYTSTWQCIEEREVDLTVTQPASEALRAQYVWGLRYIDDLIQRQRDTTGNGILDETLYAMSDRQFNVVALSDTSQSVVQRFAYTPYGQATFLTSNYGSSTNTKDWQHLFQGLHLDTETGLIENRARLLDPLTGRFVQRDPLGYTDGMNLYAAYHVMWGMVDPWGGSAEDIHDATVKAGDAVKEGVKAVATGNPNTPTRPGGNVDGHIEVREPVKGNKWNTRHTTGDNKGKFASRDNLRKQVGQAGPAGQPANTGKTAAGTSVVQTLVTLPYDQYMDTGATAATRVGMGSTICNATNLLSESGGIPDDYKSGTHTIMGRRVQVNLVADPKSCNCYWSISWPEEVEVGNWGIYLNPVGLVGSVFGVRPNTTETYTYSDVKNKKCPAHTYRHRKGSTTCYKI